MDIEPEQPKLMDQQDEQPYTLQQVSATISTNDHSVHIEKAVLQINDQGFTLLQQLPEQEWQTIFTTFSNTTSVGIDNTNLLIFVGDNQIEQQEEKPQVFTIIQQKKAANLTLNGNSFTVTLDLSKLGKNVVKQVNDIMVNYMGDADERNSKYDEDQDFSEMISADDIDQHGNIIGHKGKKEDSEQEEDFDEQGQQNK